MEIIGKKERLVGCNMKVVDSLHKYNYSSDRIGLVFNIMKIDIYDEYLFADGKAFDHQEIKIVLDDEFLKIFKTEKIVVNCRTKNEANQFCRWMHNNGSKWITGESYLEENGFSLYSENTCHTGKGTYGRFNHYLHNDYTILKFSDCVLTDEYIKNISDDNQNIDNKGEVMSSEKEYKILKSFCIKDLIDEGFNSDKIISLIDDLNCNSLTVYYLFKDKDVYEYDDIIENINWFIEKGFIERVKKFEPFELKIEINTSEQLKELWCRLNFSSVDYTKLCPGMRYYVESVDDNDLKLWRQVDKEMYRVENTQKSIMFKTDDMW